MTNTEIELLQSILRLEWASSKPNNDIIMYLIQEIKELKQWTL